MDGMVTGVFKNGGSQAVRIPKKYRFDTDEVLVSRCGDGLLLQPLRHDCSLEELFSRCDEIGADEQDFLDVRPCNSAPKARNLFP